MPTDKLRIGVIVDEHSLATEGGGYTYYQSLLNAVNGFAFLPEIEMVNILFSRKASRKLQLHKPVIFIRKNAFQAASYLLLDVLYRAWYRTVRQRRPAMGDWITRQMADIRNRSAKAMLVQEKIDLVYYLKPEENTIDYPLIVTHWDVGHKSMYPFPEVALNGNYAKRERYYISMQNRAFLILCESETGAAELLNYYPVNPDKVKVLPLFGGEVLNQQVSGNDQHRILSEYTLAPRNFFIYPAQFWAHKNHYNLVHAFHALVKESGNSHLKLVCCGTDKGNMKYILNLVDELGIKGQVIFPGFVTDAVLYTLYKNAVSLVMPTFLGPTNIPLIEAAHLGCAVLCSNLKGHKELLGDTALYFDPADSNEIKKCLAQVLLRDCRQQLVESALQRIKASPFNIDKSIRVLQQILLKLKPVRKAWGVHLSYILPLIT